jgi:hypothetical protein
MSGSSSALRTLEARFGQDFNSSGQIGTTGILDQAGDAGLFSSSATLHTPTSDLALLASSMASSFATPAGEGAGVAAAQTFDHDFLTRPAA